MFHYSKEKSFTLLELLIVIAIIAILAATVMVSLSGARQSANEARGMQFSQNIKSTLATDLVGEWSFDNQSNPGRDDSGNNNNGVIYNGTSVCNYFSGQPAGCPVWSNTPPQAKVRGALSFDGVDDYVNLANKGLNDPNLYGGALNGSMTFEAWIRPIRTSGVNYDTIARRIGGFHYFAIRSNSNPILILMVAEVDNNGNRVKNYWPTSSSKILINQWNHVVFILEGRVGYRFYINGKLDKAVSYSPLGIYNYGSDSAIGATNGAGSNYFNGFIDEVRIYKRALTAYEIKALYAQGKMRHLANNK